MLKKKKKNASQFTTEYGNISAASIGAIQRAVLAIESQGGDKFFGEPAFDVDDLIATENGRGVMNVLAADKLMHNPKLYSTFLFWLLTELYVQLPEVGDRPLPKLIFFFDEAHMLFQDTSKALVSKIEQVIRLIRSKGVVIYVITQAPSDIPEIVRGQLGNRIQHALRAYTPKDQKVVRAAAQTFRPNPEFKTEDAITELATGEALVSFLDEKGAPSIVERARILFPLSSIGPITEGQRLDINNAVPAEIKAYDKFIDRESAYEVLTAHYEKAAKAAEEAMIQAEKEKAEVAKQKEEKKKSSGKKGGITRTIFGTMIGAAATSFLRSMATQAGRQVFNKKGSSTKSSTSKKSGDTVLGRAAKTATTTATRKVTEEVLKSIFK